MEIKNTCQRWCWPTGWEPLVCSKAEYGGRKGVVGGIVQTFSYWFKYFNVIGTRPLPETEEETGGFGSLKRKHKTIIEKARPFAYGSWENARHHFRNYLEHGQSPCHGSWNGFVLFFSSLLQQEQLKSTGVLCEAIVNDNDIEWSGHQRWGSKWSNSIANVRFLNGRFSEINVSSLI